MRKTVRGVQQYGALLTAVSLILLTQPACHRSVAPVGYKPRPLGTLTFNKDIAPILFNHCAGCHRPGQSAPFSLLAYEQVKKRAADVAQVTASRLMPPWLPEPGAVEFLGERRLSDDQIGLIQQWATEGAVEGQSSDLPPAPTWAEGWLLGKPDLIVTMPRPYTLLAEGQDVYRNFVLPVSLAGTRFVRAVEFRPGNPRVVHHAVLQIDRTASSRLLDEQDTEPGFSSGMSMGKAQLPNGQFLGWTPGKLPHPGVEGMAWTLEPGTDLVLQLHLRPTGKPEVIQPMVGLYFSDRPPTMFPYGLVLRSKMIDIPAGEKRFVVTNACELPVDVEALSIYPHAHYLGREMKVTATLPDGTGLNLLLIKNWDFNWQDEYRYKNPIHLPKGSVLNMEYTFDNSGDNVRNPNHPPGRVRYGQNSSDEMAEVLLQVLPRRQEDLERLRRSSAERAVIEEIASDEAKLNETPGDAKQHIQLALRCQQIGRLDRAVAHLRRALQLEPKSARASYLLGDALAEAGQFDEALPRFREANRLVPDQPEFLGGLAQILSRHPNPGARDPEEAIRLATRAVELTGQRDPLVLETLAVAYAADGQSEKAISSSQAAVTAALALKDTELAGEIQKRLEVFKQSASGPGKSAPP